MKRSPLNRGTSNMKRTALNGGDKPLKQTPLKNNGKPLKQTPLKGGNKLLKQTPLKGGGKPMKQAPLKGGGKPLAPPKKPMKPRSDKTTKKYREERIPLVKRLLSERPWCQACVVFADVDGVVWFRPRPSRDLHEIKSRGRTGGVNSDEWLDPENILCLCRECHTRITDNPKQAGELGFLA